jgi:hypothetical protein
MYQKHLIDKVLITLDVADKTTLFILLARDGTINRKGDGGAAHELPLHRGVSNRRHFDALMMTIDETIFNYTGVMKQPNRLGKECSLTIIFQGPNEVDFSFRVVYGADSEGPPRELVDILINAVKITEGWYQEQLSAPVEKEKSGWKFWK